MFPGGCGTARATPSSQRLRPVLGPVETMGLVTGEAADYRTTTTGMEEEIIWDDDKILATVSASWKELAAVLRALYQQELDGIFPHAGSAGGGASDGHPNLSGGRPCGAARARPVDPRRHRPHWRAGNRIDTGPAWSQQMVSRGQFEEWLRQDERNAGLFQPEVRETAEPAYTTQTTAVYPGDKNHLPYDVVVQTIRTGEPEARLVLHASGWQLHIKTTILGEGGPKEKYRRNVEAIRTLKAIELEGATGGTGSPIPLCGLGRSAPSL